MKRPLRVHDISALRFIPHIYAVLHGSLLPLHVWLAKRFIARIAIICYIPLRGDSIMRDDKLSHLSMDFAVSIIELVKTLRSKKESVIANQIGRCGTSIGANIREAQYAHSKADFIAKLQIALKEANETGYWLELLLRTNYISQAEYNTLESSCRSLRSILIASLNTAKK